MERKTAFVDYYKRYGAGLVDRQFVGGLRRANSLREGLYLALGVPPSMLRDRRVIEFGPGSGHYSVFNLLQRPARYTLVDGVPEILEEAKKRLQEFTPFIDKTDFVESLFLDLKCKEPYDVVLAESCIHHQEDPGKIFKHIATFVRQTGVMIFTTVSATSCLSEIMRRLGRDAHISPSEEYNVQLDKFLPMFSEHLKHLAGVSRSAENWVLDNIVQPLSNVKLFSIPDAVKHVKDDFCILGSSPRFSQEWTWYRLLENPTSQLNRNFLKQYYECNLSLVDYRVKRLFCPESFGEELEYLCLKLWKEMCKLENGQESEWPEIIRTLREIAALIQPHADQTYSAIEEGIRWIEEGGKPGAVLGEFGKLWGRGQQHVAIYRNSRSVGVG